MSTNGAAGDESEERIHRSIYDHVLRQVVVVYASNMHQRIKTGEEPCVSSSASSRVDMFPELYKGQSSDEIKETLDEYATEMPTRQRQPLHKRRRQQKGDNDDESETAGKKKKEDGEDEEDEDDEGDDDDDEDFNEEDADDDGDDDDEDPVGKPKEATRPPAEKPVEGTEAAVAPTTTEQGKEESQEKPQQRGVDVWGRIPPKEPKNPVECKLCGRTIATSRFASHLEKCMGLSTRPSTGIPSRSSSTASAIGSAKK